MRNRHILVFLFSQFVTIYSRLPSYLSRSLPLSSRTPFLLPSPPRALLAFLSPFDCHHRHGHRARLLRLPDVPSWHIVVTSFCAFLSATCVQLVWTDSFGSRKQLSRHGSGACLTESMSVLAGPTTYGILNSELTNCPRTAAVLGGIGSSMATDDGDPPANRTGNSVIQEHGQCY